MDDEIDFSLSQNRLGLTSKVDSDDVCHIFFSVLELFVLLIALTEFHKQFLAITTGNLVTCFSIIFYFFS